MAIFFYVRNILSALKPEAHAQAQAIEIRRKRKYKENHPNFPNCLDPSTCVMPEQYMLQRKPRRKRQAQKERNILILVPALMPASRPFSRRNENYFVFACAYACPCVATENQA